MTTGQATVFEFDPDSRSGEVVYDDGDKAPFDADAFDAGGLRLLRAGQRVRVRVATDGRIEAITIVTLPLPN